jgi:hypothetical protein
VVIASPALCTDRVFIGDASSQDPAMAFSSIKQCVELIQWNNIVVRIAEHTRLSVHTRSEEKERGIRKRRVRRELSSECGPQSVSVAGNASASQCAPSEASTERLMLDVAQSEQSTMLFGISSRAKGKDHVGAMLSAANCTNSTSGA